MKELINVDDYYKTKDKSSFQHHQTYVIINAMEGGEYDDN